MKPVVRTSLTTVGLVAGGIFLAALNVGDVPFRPDRLAGGVMVGLQQGAFAIGRGVSGTFHAVGTLRDLRREHELLLGELEEYRNLRGRLEQLEGENARLREQLGFAARAQAPVVSARVIAHEASQYFASFTINRGRRHGIEPDQTVVAIVSGREGLAGKVASVSLNTSVVLPVFSAESYVSGRLDTSRHEGLVQGSGNRDTPLVMHYVPRGARNEIQYQDMVVTSGLNSIFPEGLPIGRVERVDALSFEPSLEISVTPLVEFSKLEYVFVITARSGSGQSMHTEGGSMTSEGGAPSERTEL
ncbi:rod shape-determining protein MreC [Alkalispirochaeta americana]|uniref:Cell shape-determining protein MreC n=1 Tax=Alkalispirochaeta americana TaxID=159291 RepID=A0A1N6P646_9SPIO|nr:rod shape-determining protein MreC [Alkalispirochaeta americana]SIP99769.1 rod shape-determining protein MreC [Alkalispirochaeta americana]